MKNKLNRAQLTMSESISEIENRTGIPKTVIKRILETYIDIVKECLCSEVEVVFGDIGYFGWKHWPRQENVECRNPATGEKFLMNFPAYNVMSFRQKKAWKKNMKELTIPLFAENKIEGDNL